MGKVEAYAVIVALSPVIMFNHEVCFDAVPSEHQKKNRYHLVSVLFYCVKQYSLSVLLQNCADAILQRGGICEVIVMLLLATAFNYGAYSDESPVQAPKISSNHLVAAYFFVCVQMWA